MGLLKLTWQGQAHSDPKLRSLDFKAFTRGQVVRISKYGSPRELQTSTSEMEWYRHSTSWPTNVYRKLLFKKKKIKTTCFSQSAGDEDMYGHNPVSKNKWDGRMGMWRACSIFPVIMRPSHWPQTKIMSVTRSPRNWPRPRLALTNCGS